MKILDVSMFFNEVELLEIRLHSLRDYIHTFVVIESSQTFTGMSKNLVLPKLHYLMDLYGDQLVFISREESHDTTIRFYEDIPYLSKWFPNEIAEKISSNTASTLNSIKCPRPDAILDTFQRESCLYYILKYAHDHDFILFSDADELPDNLCLLPSILESSNSSFISLRQHEFWYYPNMYVHSDWLGSLFSTPQAFLAFPSLNYLRHKTGKDRPNTFSTTTAHGYHMTSMGGAERIRQKLNSWAHQELVNPIVLSKIESNISSGHDIFYRSSNQAAVKIDLHQYYSPSFVESIKQGSLTLPSSLVRSYRTRLFTFLVRLFSKVYSFLK